MSWRKAHIGGLTSYVGCPRTEVFRVTESSNNCARPRLRSPRGCALRATSDNSLDKKS